MDSTLINIIAGSFAICALCGLIAYRFGLQVSATQSQQLEQQAHELAEAVRLSNETVRTLHASKQELNQRINELEHQVANQQQALELYSDLDGMVDSLQAARDADRAALRAYVPKLRATTKLLTPLANLAGEHPLYNVGNINLHTRNLTELAELLEAGGVQLSTEQEAAA